LRTQPASPTVPFHYIDVSSSGFGFNGSSSSTETLVSYVSV
jgi:hypothetical protein